jgi:hypothetical protein
MEKLEARQFEREIEQADGKDVPVLFYTWFGPGCPTSKPRWWDVSPDADPYPDKMEDETDDNFKQSASHSAYRCGSCYQVMRDLNRSGRVKIYNVGWSSPEDSATAQKAWKENYAGNGAPDDIIPWVWFEDLTQTKNFSRILDENKYPELMKHIKRGGRPHHVSAIITGKELLSLLLRSMYGGFTADTTVLPAVIGERYNPNLMEKGGVRTWYRLDQEGKLCNNDPLKPTDDGWCVAKLNASNALAERAIATGLRTVLCANRAAGPTQNRNLGGIIYRGQPGDMLPINGYKLVLIDTKLHNGPAVVTYDYKGRYTKSREHDDGLGDLDLIDVFFNFTPPTERGRTGAIAALKVFLEGCRDLKSQTYETLEVYNAYRGPATLSAAMTECFYGQRTPICRPDERWQNRTLTKDGRVVHVQYFNNDGVIHGFYETRNPTPQQLREGMPFRDVLGKEGYMLMAQASMVKLWSGSWKAPQDYAVPISPRVAPLASPPLSPLSLHAHRSPTHAIPRLDRSGVAGDRD